MNSRHITEYIYTASGRQLYPEEITAEDIDPFDIAYALSNIYRYNGHSQISVLRHSIAVGSLCLSESFDTYALGLLHDAAEAYMMDVPVPLKRFMTQDWLAEYARIEQVILLKYGASMSITAQAVVKRIDREVVRYEMDRPSREGLGHYNLMQYPGPRERPDPTRRQQIDEAYLWHAPEHDLIDLFVSALKRQSDRLNQRRSC